MSKEGRRVNFRLVTTSEGLEQNARSQLAFLTGTQPRLVKPNEVRAHYDRSHRNDRNDKPLAQFLEEHTERRMSGRERDEKMQSYVQFAETLLDEPASFRSYGIHAPTYLSGLEAHQHLHPQKPDEQHTSLLVGALTPSTVTEFAVVTDHVFPNARLHLLDVEGIDTRRACEASGVTFHEGNGLHMPFPNATFDSVQADYLLDQIKPGDHAPNSHLAKARRFFAEVYDVLKPGGLMLLAEPTIPRGFDQQILGSQSSLGRYGSDFLIKAYAQLIGDEITQCGFSEILIIAAPEFHSRRELDRYIMLGNSWDIPPEAIDLKVGTIVIQAVK